MTDKDHAEHGARPPPIISDGGPPIAVLQNEVMTAVRGAITSVMASQSGANDLAGLDLDFSPDAEPPRPQLPPLKAAPEQALMLPAPMASELLTAIQTTTLPAFAPLQPRARRPVGLVLLGLFVAIASGAGATAWVFGGFNAMSGASQPLAPLQTQSLTASAASASVATEKVEPYITSVQTEPNASVAMVEQTVSRSKIDLPAAAPKAEPSKPASRVEPGPILDLAATQRPVAKREAEPAAKLAEPMVVASKTEVNLLAIKAIPVLFAPGADYRVKRLEIIAAASPSGAVHFSTPARVEPVDAASKANPATTKVAAAPVAVTPVAEPRKSWARPEPDDRGVPTGPGASPTAIGSLAAEPKQDTRLARPEPPVTILKVETIGSIASMAVPARATPKTEPNSTAAKAGTFASAAKTEPVAPATKLEAVAAAPKKKAKAIAIEPEPILAPPKAELGTMVATANPQPAAPAAKSITVVVPVPVAPEDVNDQARQMLDSGSVRAARELLLKGSQTERSAVALTLARSFDPNYLQTLSHADAPADVGEARRWYLRWFELATKDGTVPPTMRIDRLLRSMQ